MGHSFFINGSKQNSGWKGIRICIPTHDNEGRVYRKNKFKLLEDLFKEIFGGVQVFTLDKGIWTNKEGKTYVSRNERVFFVRVKNIPEEKHYVKCIRDLALGIFRDQKEIEVEVTNIELWNQKRPGMKKG